MEFIRKIRRFLLENQSIRQTVVKNTFWMTLSQFSGRLLRAIVVIYAARVLGAESWGAFSYALGVAAFLTIFSDIGIGGLITRELSRHPELTSKYLATAFFIKLVLLTAGIFILISAAPFLTDSKEVLTLFPLIAILTAFDGLRDLANSLARGSEKFEIEAWVNIFTNFAVVVLGFLFLYFYPSSRSLAFAYVLGSAAGFGAIVYSMRQYFKGIVSNFSRSLVKPILTSAWPFGLMGLMGAMMINTDLIMIGFMRSIQDVGFYSAGQKPIQLLYILPGLIAVPLFPVMSRSKDNKELFSQVFKKGLRFVITAAIPISLTGIFLAKEIITFLYGKEYEPAIQVMRVLSITILTSFPAAIIGNAIFAADRKKEMLYYTALGALGNFFFNLALIPSFGIIGSAWSTVITQVISNTYAWSKVRTHLDISLLTSIWRPGIAGVATIAAILAIKPFALPVLITIALASGIYGLVLYLLKEPLIKEIASIFS